MRTIEESIALLDRLGPSTIALGLERIHEALARLAHPERGLRVLHVAGTNGKGSTCAMAASILRASGRRVGLYTSPHLVRFNERIRIDGEDLPDALLAQRIEELVERLPGALEGPAALTYFEFATLLAFWHFAREEVDAVVLETGLGGRLDATNACVPAITALTPIALDHPQYLGNTLASIAREKAGILEAGIPVVVARQPAEALEEIAGRARTLGAPLLLEGRDFSLEPEASGALVYRAGAQCVGGLQLSLRGSHQRQNAAVAVASVLALTGGRLEPGAIRAGLASARWPGRFECLPGTPTVILDGAHNPAGAEVLVRALEECFPERRRHLIFGALADKDAGAMLRILAPAVASVRLVAPVGPRGLAPEVLEPVARERCADVATCPSLPIALEQARGRAAPGDVVVIAGSLVLVGSAASLLSTAPPLGAVRQGP